jgi:hypothetical protein
MFSGPPLPLSPDVPLRQLVVHACPPGILGAWMRGSTQELRLPGGPMRSGARILVSADLGLLLSRCNRVAVRENAELMVLDAELLIQWRVLQVVTGTPYLPGLERLWKWFPGFSPSPAGFSIPIATRSPEEVLADCITHGIPVAGSRIIYRAPTRA